MRLLVCGPRDCDKTPEVFFWLNAINAVTDIDVIIHGNAYGPDKISGQWAAMLGVSTEVYPADWEKYGRAAGPRRNANMLVEGQPDRVLAFQPRGQETPGTQNMIKLAKQAGVPVTIVEF